MGKYFGIQFDFRQLSDMNRTYLMEDIYTSIGCLRYFIQNTVSLGFIIKNTNMCKTGTFNLCVNISDLWIVV